MLDVHVMTIQSTSEGHFLLTLSFEAIFKPFNSELPRLTMWVKVNGWIWLPDNAEISQQQERSSSKRAWEDWSQRGWWSADSGTTTQEGDRTTTQEGDRTAQEEGTTTQEGDGDDGYQPQQKKKHQKMDYDEIRSRDQTSSWWDWQQHGEWPGWQQWPDCGQSSTDAWNLHAWTESWPETISAQYTSVPEEEMEAVLDTATLGVENLQLASSSGPFAPDNSADLVLPASSSGPCAPDNSADLVLPPSTGTIDPPIASSCASAASLEPSVSSALSESQSQSATSPGSGVHRKVPRAKKGPQFQKRKWKSRKQKL